MMRVTPEITDHFMPSALENTDYDTATIYGQIENWPTKTGMAQILRDAGLKVYVGRYSVRVENCERFIF